MLRKWVKDNLEGLSFIFNNLKSILRESPNVSLIVFFDSKNVVRAQIMQIAVSICRHFGVKLNGNNIGAWIPKCFEFLRIESEFRRWLQVLYAQRAIDVRILAFMRNGQSDSWQNNVLGSILLEVKGKEYLKHILVQGLLLISHFVLDLSLLLVF